MPRAERKIHISLTVSRSELAEIDYMTDKMTPGVTYFRNEVIMEAIREAARKRGLSPVEPALTGRVVEKVEE